MRNNGSHLPGLKIQYAKDKPFFYIIYWMTGKATITHALSELSEINDHFVGWLMRSGFEINFSIVGVRSLYLTIY